MDLTDRGEKESSSEHKVYSVAGAIGRQAWVTYPVREGKVKTQVKTQVLASRINLPQRDLFFFS